MEGDLTNKNQVNIVTLLHVSCFGGHVLNILHQFLFYGNTVLCSKNNYTRSASYLHFKWVKDGCNFKVSPILAFISIYMAVYLDVREATSNLTLNFLSMNSSKAHASGDPFFVCLDFHDFKTFHFCADIYIDNV